MARNRQRAKQRQDARRAARGQSGDGPSVNPREDAAPADGDEREDIERTIDLEVGAPPEDLGTSDDTLQHSPMKEEEADELLDDDEDYDFEDEEQPLDGEPAVRGPRGVRGGREPAPGEEIEKGRGRLVAFLIAVVAELKRVQWPTRKQSTQMTGIVLGFVLIAGGYLGLLDAIFSRLIKEIL